MTDRLGAAGRREDPTQKKTAGANFATGRSAARLRAQVYFRWFETSFVISNIETFPLPPNTAFSFSSALIIRLLTASCSLFF